MRAIVKFFAFRKRVAPRVKALAGSLARVLGDGEYARYCAHLRRRHPDRAIPTARDFYRARLEEKFSRPSRCC